MLLAQSDFAGARKALEQSLALRKEGEDKVLLGETQLELADLSLEEGRVPSEVETDARQAVEDFKKEKAWDDEALAWALVARALFAEQKFEEAKPAATEALRLSEKSPSVEIRLDNCNRRGSCASLRPFRIFQLAYSQRSVKATCVLRL